MTDEALRIVIVGHTNAGKTSLLRTLTRQVDFGTVAEQPGTTRHAEAVALRLDGRVAIRFVDTPGLEDSVALQGFLAQNPGDSRLERIRAFLRGPEALGTFEQEAKVLRALLDSADAAMLVIDTREPVLPKHRAEIDILAGCARPIMPVLNFVADAASRRAEWQQALLECGLHARVAFDAVAPFHGAETQLYRDLGALLPERRAQLSAVADALLAQERDRMRAAGQVIAEGLIDVAAMRRDVPEGQAESRLPEFRAEVAHHAERSVQALLALYQFRADDATLEDWPELAGRWEDDLFNPELLKDAGKRLGIGAVIGAGVGAAVDVALAGLSLGAATALGATLGGASSGGWRPLWRKLENRLAGVRELSVEDAVLLLLADRLCLLAGALARRGHAAQQRLKIGGSTAPAPGAEAGPGPMIRMLGAARGHPEWERGRRGFDDAADRAALRDELAARLVPLLGHEG